MRILLTNDDGINAPGFAVLERIAATLSDDVWAVAPSEEQSGTGHSLTLTRPIRMRRVNDKRFAVSGTPTDAVMMALAHIMKDSPPDLILSGVNRGANLAEDVTYSGSVSAAMEGALRVAYASSSCGDSANCFATSSVTFWVRTSSASDSSRRTTPCARPRCWRLGI